MKNQERQELVELHAHLGTSINPAVLWSIASENGIKLPVKNYWNFQDMIVLSKQKKMSVPDYLEKIYHPILDQLSSGTHAVEKAVHETIGGAYRSSFITIHELRMNPMRHNAGGRQDMDHIIMAALRGMERALLEFPDVQAGIIFCMAREFPKELNAIIAKKAIKYHHRGVVGIDISGVAREGFDVKDYADIMAECRDAGLGITVHSGEAYEIDTNNMWEVINYLEPDRIGHGIRAAYDKKIMRELVKRKIVLEICPVSNIVTRAVRGVKELQFILQTFKEEGVRFTINTDWPETVEKGHLTEQLQFLKSENMLTDIDIANCMVTAQKATFTKPGGVMAYI